MTVPPSRGESQRAAAQVVQVSPLLGVRNLGRGSFDYLPPERWGRRLACWIPGGRPVRPSSRRWRGHVAHLVQRGHSVPPQVHRLRGFADRVRGDDGAGRSLGRALSCSARCQLPGGGPNPPPGVERRPSRATGHMGGGYYCICPQRGADPAPEGGARSYPLAWSCGRRPVRPAARQPGGGGGAHREGRAYPHPASCSCTSTAQATPRRRPRIRAGRRPG